MNRVAIVVLNYKGIEDTINCIASLMKQTIKDAKVILVENGSGDNSIKEFKKLEKKYGDKLQTLYNTENLGFDGGVNTGITWALNHNYENIALFNNDAIADSKWIESLLNASDADKDVGITTGLLLHQDGKTIDSTGDWLSTWGLPFPRNRNDKTNKAPAAEYVFGGTGGASLFKAALFRDIGTFDEDFFAYYEDTDISFRAQLAGWKVLYVPEAVAYHQQGATSNKMPGGFTTYQTFKNLPLVIAKDVPTELLLSIGIRFWFAYFLMLGHAIKRGQGKAAIRGYLRSVILFWKSALSKRRHIQSHRKVSNNYIRSILWPDLPPDQTGIRKVRRFFTGR